MDTFDSSVSERPRPPAPRPRKTVPGALAFFLALRGSAIEGFAEAHYSEPMVVTPTILGTVVVVTSPSAVRHVMLANAKNYPRQSLQRRIVSDGFGYGLISAEGEQWRRQRKALAPHFTPEKIAAMEGVVAGAVSDMLDGWRRRGDGAMVRVDHDIPQLSIDILERTLFPDGLGEEKEAFFTALKSYFASAGKLGVLDVLKVPDFIPRIATLRSRRGLATLSRVVDRTIALWHAGKTDAGRKTMLSDISQARPTLDPVEVRDNVGTLLSAGSETSAGAMCWALYLLSQDEEWRARVEAEVDRELPGGDYVPGALPRLVMTRAVVEETLRLYPTVSVTVREAIEKDEIDGLPIAPGTIVVVSPWLIHRHRTLWSDPDTFDPARFLPGAREKIDRFSYLPFGAGPRVCIGQGFAIQEMVVSIASIARNFRLTPAAGFRLWPSLSVSLQPAGAMPMVLGRRGRQVTAKASG